jgi:hypothetical protein
MIMFFSLSTAEEKENRYENEPPGDEQTEILFAAYRSVGPRKPNQKPHQCEKYLLIHDRNHTPRIKRRASYSGPESGPARCSSTG